ncbi:MAG: transposase [Minisyncoccia bacterium]
MSIRKISFAEGEYYHLYNRGNSKQIIFIDDLDYNRFLSLIFLCNSRKNINFRDAFEINEDIFNFDRDETIVDIGSYCLMTNHFHLLVKEKSEGGISLFMQKLSTAYVMYFNKKYTRSGSLFEGKFKSQHVDSDKYLKYIFSYIHLNPVKLIFSKWKKEGIRDKNEAYNFSKQYKYSSFFLFNKEKEEKFSYILNILSFPKYFNNASEYKKEIFEWLNYP